MKHRLLDHQNGVVDHNTGQNDETEHRQHVERLPDEIVQQCQPGYPAGRRNRHRQQNDQRQHEIPQQHDHQKEDHAKRNHHIRLHGFPCGVQRARRAAQRNAHTRLACLRANFGDQLGFDDFHRLFQRQGLGRPQAQRDRLPAADPADLLRCADNFDFGELSELQHRAGAGDNRDIAKLGRGQLAGILAGHHKIDQLAGDRNLDDVGAVIEHIHGRGDVANRNPCPCQRGEIRSDPDLRRAIVEIGKRANLISLGPREQFANPLVHAEGNGQDGLAARAADIDPDRARATDRSPEQRCLAYKGAGSGLGEDRPAQHKLQFGHARRVLRRSASKGTAGKGHEEEALDGGRTTLLGLGFPKRPRRRFHFLGDAKRFIERIAGRRENPSEGKIGVAVRKIIKLRHEPRGEAEGAGHNQRDHNDADKRAFHGRAGIGNDQIREPACDMIKPGDPDKARVAVGSATQQT